MKRINRQRLAAGMTAALIVAIAWIAPGFAYAQEEDAGRPPKPVEIVGPLPLPVDINHAGLLDVNLANTPTVELSAGTSVRIDNDDESAVPVRLIAPPPPQDYHVSNDYFIKCTEGAGGNAYLSCFGGRDEINCGTNRCPIFEVPEDYYLVIEHVNVHRDEEIGDEAFLTFEVYTRLERREAGELWGPVYHRVSVAPKIVSEPVTLYAGGNTVVNVDIHDEDVSGENRYVRISWTGRLVPVPPR